VELVEHSFTGEKGDCVRIRLYTETNCYAIVAKDRGDPVGELKNAYLGCIASTRKPRAGEDWTRGNDLPDGPFSEETWRKILGAIVGYELVKVHVKQEGDVVDGPVAAVAPAGPQ
jgi:hypothetical protein